MTIAVNTPMMPIADSNFYADIISAIGSKLFFSKIADLTCNHIVFDGLFVCIYSTNSAPISMGCFREAQNFQPGIENYLKYSYVINPVYRAFQDIVTTGVYTMNDLLHTGMKDEIAQSEFHIWVDDQETIGYRTPGWPKKMTESLGLIWLPDKTMVELCFLNTQESTQAQKFSTGLEAIFPAISSAVIKHFEVFEQDSVTSMADPNLAFLTLDFGKDVLTEREQDVVQLILKGYSSKAIAVTLGISLPTVKTHRRNIYARLKISSQVELFNLFVQKMMEIST
ncbi:MAG: helix-turn-helix transcriptional regulator [Devosiaceae bacterium]|nr:helix-turn-helix transcriptional regulator [Devosiaceae bacterium]